MYKHWQNPCTGHKRGHGMLYRYKPAIMCKCMHMKHTFDHSLLSLWARVQHTQARSGRASFEHRTPPSLKWKLVITSVSRSRLTDGSHCTVFVSWFQAVIHWMYLEMCLCSRGVQEIASHGGKTATFDTVAKACRGTTLEAPSASFRAQQITGLSIRKRVLLAACQCVCARHMPLSQRQRRLRNNLTFIIIAPHLFQPCWAWLGWRRWQEANVASGKKTLSRAQPSL